jgi:hypothetical protein
MTGYNLKIGHGCFISNKLFTIVESSRIRQTELQNSVTTHMRSGTNVDVHCRGLLKDKSKNIPWRSKKERQRNCQISRSLNQNTIWYTEDTDNVHKSQDRILLMWNIIQGVRFFFCFSFWSEFIMTAQKKDEYKSAWWQTQENSFIFTLKGK